MSSHVGEHGVSGGDDEGDGVEGGGGEGGDSAGGASTTLTIARCPPLQCMPSPGNGSDLMQAKYRVPGIVATTWYRFERMVPPP